MLLLSNTSKTKHALENYKQHIKEWLINAFGTELAVFVEGVPCSSAQLMNLNTESYQSIFTGLEPLLHNQKQRRYSAQEILRLNQRSPGDRERECKVCHRVDQLLQVEDDEDSICNICAQLSAFGREVVRDERYFLVLKSPPDNAPFLPLPNFQGKTAYITILNKKRSKEYLEEGIDLIRVYSKNNPSSGVLLATNLWMGDAFYSPGYSENGPMSTFEDLARDAAGINQVGILRADVDNLGQIFIDGFKSYAKAGEKSAEYTTLSRTATLSRSLAVFFKYHINLILEKPAEILPFTPHAFPGTKQIRGRRTNIVYAGGDDMFIAGSWDDMLLAGLDLREAFRLYTGNTLSFSAGYGIYHAHYPLIRMASETAELEGLAKGVEKKDALALFSPKFDQDQTYHWDEVWQNVLNNKLNLLVTHLGLQDKSQSTFAYRILQLLTAKKEPSDQKNSPEPIQIARLAYHLFQHQKNSSTKIPQGFTTDIYTWALKPQDLRELITALYLYHYLNRTTKEA